MTAPLPPEAAFVSRHRPPAGVVVRSMSAWLGRHGWVSESSTVTLTMSRRRLPHMPPMKVCVCPWVAMVTQRRTRPDTVPIVDSTRPGVGREKAFLRFSMTCIMPPLLGHRIDEHRDEPEESDQRADDPHTQRESFIPDIGGDGTERHHTYGDHKLNFSIHVLLLW